VDFGLIKSIEIGKNLDSGENVRLAQVNIVGEDTVTVEMPFPEGDEFVPAVGDTVYYEEVDAGLLVARCIQSAIPVDSSLGTGEREMFSRSGSSRKAKIRLKNDGVIIINDGTDYAVKFEELQAGLDDMMKMLNSFLGTVKTHGHASFGTASPDFQLVVDPELDISDAKVDEVQL
jgi:hypothetical protein